jgi:hypothetical protein
MKKSIIFLKSVSVSVFLGIGFTAGAQKLPNVQQQSVIAPADIKMDGKATEWDNTFKAYNNATEVFYTISNNTENLYLTIRATEVAVIQKIVSGGITFTLKNTDKKSTIAPVSITYPLVQFQYSQVNYLLKRAEPMAEPALYALNKQLTDHQKDITITGVKEIPDGLVSVYNDQGIRAAALIDNKKAYTIEIAIPLKYLQQEIDGAATFSYILQINGLSTQNVKVVGGINPNADPQDVPVDHAAPNFDFAPTYCKGEYTLAKK